MSCVCVRRCQLAITSTPNQDNPLMDGAEGEKMIPFLGLDVWVCIYACHPGA